MKKLTTTVFLTKSFISRPCIRSTWGNSFFTIILLSLLLSILLNQPCFAHQNLPRATFDVNQEQIRTYLPKKLQNTLWWHVARQHQLDPYILYAVALIESANSSGTTKITPWPWAINKAGKSILSDNQRQADAILKKSIAEGNKHIDIGLMQINLHWHGNRVSKPEDLLNPVTNLTVGARLLAEAIQSSPNDLVIGIGRYHSWENMPAAILYGRRVLALAEQIRDII